MAQATLSLVVLVQYAGLALGALAASLVGGAIAVAGGLVATGGLVAMAPPLVWVLPPIAGVGLGAASTAASTKVGISIEQEDQGQAAALLGYVGAALGCLWARLYAPARGVEGAPFLVGGRGGGDGAVSSPAPRGPRCWRRRIGTERRTCVLGRLRFFFFLGGKGPSAPMAVRRSHGGAVPRSRTAVRPGDFPARQHATFFDGAGDPSL